MRSVYILVGVFFVWCIAASFWFLFWVKGLSPQPDNINPHESALAIVEILLMILISVLIGFALAWLLKQEVVRKKEQDIQNLLTDRATHESSARLLQEQAHKAETTLARARETFREDFLTVSRDNERLKTELEEVLNAGTQAEEINRIQLLVQSLQSQLDQSKNETSLLEATRQKLQTEVEELQRSKREVKKPIEVTEKQLSAKIIADEKDDLKIINGIGPGIEKKLNTLGIYSFRQISELTEESIKQLTESIKFFPGRIDRDRWVEQASKLYLDKIRK
jgi:predicted flap endonuclease-1-like 5' DNA nuclease